MAWWVEDEDDGSGAKWNLEEGSLGSWRVAVVGEEAEDEEADDGVVFRRMVLVQ